jgi:alpha-L-fucosidase
MGQDWFLDAGFGLFVHWSHCSQQGRELSWPLVGGTTALPHSHPVPVDEWYSHALDFDPRPGAPVEWAERGAAAGARYLVLTTKHHDGFALWPTATSDFHIGNAAYGGDLVGEYVDATRSAGLRVGLYFSLSDWHHPDYPAFRDDMRPYQFIAYPRPSAEAWARFGDDLMTQLTELLTHYGTIDVLWFDGGWERTAAEWRSAELETHIRSLQPDIVINDRLPGVGDFTTPEQFVPPEAPEGRWETCLTMNESWGWVPDDLDLKSPHTLVRVLAEIVGRGGNLLLNISPTADGSLPPTQVERLDALTGWMHRNAEAIHDTRPGLEPWQFYGPSTRRADVVYLICVQRPYDTVTVRGVPIRRVEGARHLASDTPLAFRGRCTVLDELLNSDPVGELEITVPPALIDELATVVELRITPP